MDKDHWPHLIKFPKWGLSNLIQAMNRDNSIRGVWKSFIQKITLGGNVNSKKLSMCNSSIQKNPKISVIGYFYEREGIKWIDE